MIIIKNKQFYIEISIKKKLPDVVGQSTIYYTKFYKINTCYLTYGTTNNIFSIKKKSWIAKFMKTQIQCEKLFFILFLVKKKLKQ